jgi:hypothetical protein
MGKKGEKVEKVEKLENPSMEKLNESLIKIMSLK